MSTEKILAGLPMAARGELEALWDKRDDYAISGISRDAFVFIYSMAFHTGVIHSCDSMQAARETARRELPD